MVLQLPLRSPAPHALSRAAWLRGIAVVSVIACTITVARSQSPNVLILLADDVGVDKIGAYGVGIDPPPTPSIDRLAQEGVLFRNAWSSPECSPTRALIQTGRHAFRTGVGAALVRGMNRGSALPLDEITLPEHLDAQSAGYAHGAFGKWHLSDQTNGGRLGPNLAGWSFYSGALEGTASYYRWQWTRNGVTRISTRYNTTQTVDDALAWIHSVPEPWVCYVAFPAAHTPLHNPPAYLHTYPLAQLTEPPPMMQYKAMVQAMDSEIGRLLAGLEDKRARTDVIFAGDNGTQEEFIEPPFPRFFGKHTVYQGGVLVPLIIAGPSVQAPGRDVDAFVGLVDVFATVSELCGVAASPPFVRSDSVSMQPYLRDPGQVPLRQTLLTEQFTGAPLAQPTTTQYAFRDDRYKLVYIGWPNPREELYDLVADPYESNNLLERPTPEVLERLEALRESVIRLRYSAGDVAKFGELSCVGSNGAPAIDLAKDGPPVLGRPYEVELRHGPASSPAFLVLGASRTRYGAGSLPFALHALGAGTGCFLHASMDHVLPVQTDAKGAARVAVTVPGLRLLEAVPIYHTWLALDALAPQNPLGVTTSNGLVVQPWIASN